MSLHRPPNSKGGHKELYKSITLYGRGSLYSTAALFHQKSLFSSTTKEQRRRLWNK